MKPKTNRTVALSILYQRKIQKQALQQWLTIEKVSIYFLKSSN